MDISTPEAWASHVLEPLSEEKTCTALSDANTDWEYIDSEMVKLGSLTHAQLNIVEIQQRTLKLLASESKDFRLMVHLLRTLQHAGKAEELLLAVKLLTQYLEHFWARAWPQKEAHKVRFAQQIIKRFETAVASFTLGSNQNQRDNLLGEFAHLSQFWLKNGSGQLAAAVDALFALYQRHFLEPITQLPQSASQISGNTASDSVTTSPHVPTIAVENHDDKAWRQTQLKVADLLCELHPQCAVGFRLRRHAIWQTITSAPQAETDGRTQLAAFSADLLEDYQARFASANSELWEQVEKSLLLAPYWFDGHHLSARIALLLGHSDSAEAIRDELNAFLNRIPALKNLLFNDHTPYLSDATQRWLEVSAAKNNAGSSANSDSETQSIWQCFNEQGLAPALQLLDQYHQQDHEPRQQFYRQYFGAQLLEHAGMAALAHQQYKALRQAASQITLPDWEPALLEQLEEKITTAQ